MLERVIEAARREAERRSFLYEDARSYAGGIDELARALAVVLAEQEYEASRASA